ncbi:phytoene/squalene synthase family protein [Evansella cellulosilytica]|uniref:Phytoene synthase n=1 Tax=Evansella cellulosilytica (strain ATCC 21833 / DSM 2522 / FERM P-1141 / JCM 9156 / N-4) TaxID=649639 RepID=E6TWF8_EVAC2|nr:phytoene/squalene synthase family protein [Evansella cellulosilytica]ADU32221.1 Phytoene synthase [Evansella cellulosilytica DSM 2522]
MEISVAYKMCQQVMEHHSKSFSKAFQLLPLEKRQAVWAIYAFCRTVDDIVDEGTNPVTELNDFKTNFEQFRNGTIDESDYLWIALNDTFSKFDFDIQPFLDMVKGQEMDLYKSRYNTMEELEQYAYYVASTVGLMLLPILSPENKEQLRPSAISLGLAMQITNILRDIGEDLDRDRIYIPKDLRDKHNYTDTMLANKEVNPAFVRMCEELSNIAEQNYEKGLANIELYPQFSRLPVTLSAYYYKAILTSIRQNNYDVFGKRAYVTTQQKQHILKMVAKA